MTLHHLPPKNELLSFNCYIYSPTWASSQATVTSSHLRELLVIQSLLGITHLRIWSTICDLCACKARPWSHKCRRQPIKFDRASDKRAANYDNRTSQNGCYRQDLKNHCWESFVRTRVGVSYQVSRCLEENGRELDQESNAEQWNLWLTKAKRRG